MNSIVECNHLRAEPLIGRLKGEYRGRREGLDSIESGYLGATRSNRKRRSQQVRRRRQSVDGNFRLFTLYSSSAVSFWKVGEQHVQVDTEKQMRLPTKNNSVVGKIGCVDVQVCTQAKCLVCLCLRSVK